MKPIAEDFTTEWPVCVSNCSGGSFNCSCIKTGPQLLIIALRSKAMITVAVVTIVAVVVVVVEKK